MAKKNQPTALTPDELKNLRDSLQEVNQAKLQLADNVLAKAEMLLSMNALKNKFAEVEKSITEKYGVDITLNIETGAITPKE
jgi:hypothetical protein